MKILNQNLYVLHIRDAVIRQVMIIGEASKNAPEELKKEYANIPWKKISGSRDKMTHDYADIELDIIWRIVPKIYQNSRKQLTDI